MMYYITAVQKMLKKLSTPDISEIRSDGRAVRHAGLEPDYIRDKDGNILWPADLGKIEITTTGLSITFPDDNLAPAYFFLKSADKTLNAFADDRAKNYYRRRLTMIAYYSLISELGRTVSRMTGTGYDEINVDTVSGFISKTKGASQNSLNLSRIILFHPENLPMRMY